MKAKVIYRVFPSKEQLAESFAGELADKFRKSYGRKTYLSIALSGGTTPGLLLSVLAEKFSRKIEWNRINFYWVDERCVPPDDPESNYGMTKKLFLDKIDIPSSNVFRMKGEADPPAEAKRYSELIAGKLRVRNSLPFFDLVLLGMGADGHTASIFPGNKKLLDSRMICESARHPVTQQLRLTLTGKVINNSGSVFFLVTGGEKARMVEMIYRNDAGAKNIPAAHIRSVNGATWWLLDHEAGLYVV